MANHKPSAGATYATYARAFVVTVGLFFASVPGLVWIKQRDRSSEWTVWCWLLLESFGVAGITLIIAGVFASKRTVNKWAERCSHHEASIFAAILAAPVYLVMSLFSSDKENKND